MDWQFVKKSVICITPLVFLFSVFFWGKFVSADYAYHAYYGYNQYYPTGLFELMNSIPLERGVSLFFISVLAIVFCPFVLIYEITYDMRLCWVYLYGSGIPLLIFQNWFIPQAIIHCMILLGCLNPIYTLVLIVFGGLFHNEFLFGLVPIGIYHYLKRDRHD